MSELEGAPTPVDVAGWHCYESWDSERVKVPCNTQRKYQKLANYITTFVKFFDCERVFIHEPGGHYLPLAFSELVACVIVSCGSSVVEREDIERRLQTISHLGQSARVETEWQVSSLDAYLQSHLKPTPDALILCSEGSLPSWEEAHLHSLIQWLCAPDSSRSNVLETRILVCLCDAQPPLDSKAIITLCEHLGWHIVCDKSEKLFHESVRYHFVSFVLWRRSTFVRNSISCLSFASCAKLTTHISIDSSDLADKLRSWREAQPLLFSKRYILENSFN